MGNTTNPENLHETIHTLKAETIHTLRLTPVHSPQHASHTNSAQHTHKPTRDIKYNIYDDEDEPKQMASPRSQAITLIPVQNRVSSIALIFRYKKQLGKGASCRVLLVEHRKQKKLFALKEMTRSVSKNGSLFYSEVCILRKISHPNIVKIHDVYMDKSNFYICLQYCSGGTMLERIISDTHFSEQIASNYLKNILETVEFMHQRNIVHLDLKLNNIVFNSDKKYKNDTDGSSSKPSVLTIIDFGLSEEILDENYIYDEIHGSLHYFPPEIFNDEGRNGWQLKKGDIWSIGIVSYLILSGKLPFYGNSQKAIINAIRKGDFKWPTTVSLSQDCKSFISGLLNPDPIKRWNATQALKHPWLTDNSHNQNLGNSLMKTLHNFNFKNQLQRILINSVLSEMNDKEKGILIQGVEELDSNKDGFLDAEDIMTYILQNQVNLHMKDFSYADHDNINKHLRRRSEDILLEMKLAISLVQDSEDLSQQQASEQGMQNDNSNADIKHEDMLLQNLMDEIETDFKDYDFQQDEAEQKVIKTQFKNESKIDNDTKTDSTLSELDMNTIKPSLVPLQSPRFGYSSGDTPDEMSNDNHNGKHARKESISVALFRKIMYKTAINVDDLVAELDPDDSGIIKLSSINAFGRSLSQFRIDPNAPETPDLAPQKSNQNGNSIANLSESTVILKPKRINRVKSKNIHRIDECAEDSDSEIDFPDHLFYVD